MINNIFMQSSEQEFPEPQLLEQLKRLRPAMGRLHRDRVLFLAGKASVKPVRVWPWCLASGTISAVVSSILTVLLMLALPIRGPATHARRNVAAAPDAWVSPLASDDTASESGLFPKDKLSYWQLREASLALDQPANHATTRDLACELPSSYGQLLEKLWNAS